jgi:hypothetical protein
MRKLEGAGNPDPTTGWRGRNIRICGWARCPMALSKLPKRQSADHLAVRLPA